MLMLTTDLLWHLGMRTWLHFQWITLPQTTPNWMLLQWLRFRKIARRQLPHRVWLLWTFRMEMFKAWGRKRRSNLNQLKKCLKVLKKKLNLPRLQAKAKKKLRLNQERNLRKENHQRVDKVFWHNQATLLQKWSITSIVVEKLNPFILKASFLKSNQPTLKSPLFWLRRVKASLHWWGIPLSSIKWDRKRKRPLNLRTKSRSLERTTIFAKLRLRDLNSN